LWLGKRQYYKENGDEQTLFVNRFADGREKKPIPSLQVSTNLYGFLSIYMLTGWALSFLKKLIDY